MSHAQNGLEPRHPIGVISGRTGLPQDVLRAWERRYDAVVPHRTETGRRLYTDRDLEKLQLLRRAVVSGRRISDVAALDVGDLRELVQEDTAFPDPPAPGAVPGSRRAARMVEIALAAVRDLDTHRLKAVLAEASVDLPQPILRSDLIQPLLDRIGDEWRSGSLRIAHEHLATGIVRSFLDSLRWNREVPPGAPAVVVTTPAGQRHELGALVVTLAALEVGWEGVYLGANVPAAEIVAAARQKEARAVALSLASTAGEAPALQELRTLRGFLGPSFPLFVGGRALESYSSVLEEIGARQIMDPAAFQAALDELARR